MKVSLSQTHVHSNQQSNFILYGLELAKKNYFIVSNVTMLYKKKIVVSSQICYLDNLGLHRDILATQSISKDKCITKYHLEGSRRLVILENDKCQSTIPFVSEDSWLRKED